MEQRLEETRARPAPSAALAGKYMTFRLAGEDYGVEILAVREIIGLLEITRVPRAPAFIRGVINLRGKVIPVLDLRLQFGLSPAEATDQAVIIVVQCQVGGRQLTMGVLVDQVLEVLAIEASQVEPPPDLGAAAIDGDFILGVGKAGDRVVFLLDIARALSGADAAALRASVQS
jgi:purine-binding chemotaxis protein CheW